MNGVINVNKPLGITSHDVVYRLRKILSVKKIGHTGTLDPGAEGVLPMCIGRATKIADMLTAQNKQYIAEVKLGAATDTLDSSGNITKTAKVNITETELTEIIAEFVGEIEQIPPMFSAIKINGKKLYELARKGEEIDRKPRIVTIEGIEILNTDLKNNIFTMKVDCSKGTYIRTLCDDIGKRLGCYAHMSGLKRTCSGRFDISQSFTLDEIEKMYISGDMSFLIPVDKIFDEYERIVLTSRKAKKMCNGTQVAVQGVTDGNVYRVYDEVGNFLTISRAENGVMKILKTFYQTIDGGGVSE